MAIRNALSLCPDAAVLAPDPVLYRALWASILQALNNVSPEVEDEELGRAYLNAGGLGALYRDERDLALRIVDAVRESSGLSPSVGLAEGKFAALAAASMTDPGEAQSVPAGSEADFLAPLEVELLPVSSEVIARLRLLGLEAIGEVAAIPLPALQTQFGFEGRRLWQLANGIDEEPLRPAAQAETVEAGFAFEAPVAGIDVLVAAGKQLLSRLRPALRGRSARELTLQAELASGRGWERRLVLREAVSEDERLTFVLRSALTNKPPPAAVKSLSLRLGALTGETGKQLDLGQRGRLQKQLEEALCQLKARYGFSPIYRCLEVEPWSVIPEERQILVESDA
jgi:nucleotidyltransferase/DNA polymerase involved in DNA repair